MIDAKKKEALILALLDKMNVPKLDPVKVVVSDIPIKTIFAAAVSMTDIEGVSAEDAMNDPLVERIILMWLITVQDMMERVIDRHGGEKDAYRALMLWGAGAQGRHIEELPEGGYRALCYEPNQERETIGKTPMELADKLKLDWKPEPEEHA